MEKHDGIYIPPELHKQRRPRFSLDNIDAKVDASDGRNSFHATAMAVYQRKASTEDRSECIKPTQDVARSLKDVPTTIVPLIYRVQLRATPSLQLAHAIHYSRQGGMKMI